MKAVIRQRALELGFDDCRFTNAAAPASAEKFQNWLTQKKHGGMAYLERNAPKRIDPQKVLPGAKSIIVLASSYQIENPQSAIRNPASSPAMQGLTTITMFSASG
jgi:epoxyqueuosine reductase